MMSPPLYPCWGPIDRRVDRCSTPHYTSTNMSPRKQRINSPLGSVVGGGPCEQHTAGRTDMCEGGVQSRKECEVEHTQNKHGIYHHLISRNTLSPPAPSTALNLLTPGAALSTLLLLLLTPRGQPR